MLFHIIDIWEGAHTSVFNWEFCLYVCLSLSLSHHLSKFRKKCFYAQTSKYNIGKACPKNKIVFPFQIEEDFVLFGRVPSSDIYLVIE